MFQSLMLVQIVDVKTASTDFILDDTFWVVLSSLFLCYVVLRLFNHVYPWQWKKLFYLFDSGLELRFVLYSKIFNLSRSVSVFTEPITVKNTCEIHSKLLYLCTCTLLYTISQ